MTHEYTILIGGVVIPGGSSRTCTAIAWAADTILALGSDEVVLGISRGDSAVVRLEGLVVTPLADGDVLEVGGPADFAVLAAGARYADGAPVAVIRGGHIAEGELPGLEAHEHPPHR